MDHQVMLERLFEEVINKGNLGVIDELFAEDYVDHGPMGDMHGREAFKALVAKWRDAVPDVHCTIKDVFSSGDQVAWLVHATGTHTGDGLGFPATGKRFETISPNIARFRGDQAIEHWAEQGMISMLGQLGVLPIGG